MPVRKVHKGTEAKAGNLTPRAGTAACLLCQEMPSWVETARKLLGQSSGERTDGGGRSDCHQHLCDQLSKCGKDLGKCQRGGQNDAPSPRKPSQHREHTMPDTPLPFVLEL